MYTDIWELISLYSERPKDHAPVADEIYSNLVAEHEKVYIRSQIHELEGYVNLYWHEEGKQCFVLFVPDKKLKTTGSNFMSKPLTKVCECNYNWYKLYLNIIAYISGGPVASLRLVRVGWNNKVVEVEYRPELMQILIKDYELKKISNPDKKNYYQSLF